MKFLSAAILVLLIANAILAGDMVVTVYNSNLGVVSETRSLDFQKGIRRLPFRDVPSQIDPASVRFEVLTPGQEISILEQDYAYDLVSPEQMYRKYVDHEVQLIDRDGRLYSGTLLAYSGGAVTLLEDNGRVKVVRLQNVTEISFPSLPEGLITRPTLFWKYSSGFSGDLECRVGYQTSGLDWEAEYVGVLDGKETDLGLSGWSSITNSSGKTYRDAKLKLIAGDIGRAQPEQRGQMMDKMMTMAPEAAGFEEKAFFEYHLYTLPRLATLADKEIKQISLFEPANSPVTKTYTFRPDRNPSNVDVELLLTNSKESGLGMPLPAGRVRLFKADDDGSLILLGEDRIKHTPRDEEIKLRVGAAFDIVAEEKVLDQRRISNRVEERDYQIEIRNRKSEDITVEIEKKLHGVWEILKADLEFSKEDAYTVKSEVLIPAGQVRTFAFTVRFGAN